MAFGDFFLFNRKYEPLKYVKILENLKNGFFILKLLIAY